MINVSVWYTPGGADWGVISPQMLEVVGGDDELLRDAVSREVGKSIAPLLVVDVDEDGRDELVLGHLDELTMVQAARFADGSTLHLSVVGVGGGPITAIVELVLAGLTVADVLDRLRQGGQLLAGYKHGERRAAAERWVIEGGRGEPSLALRQMVCERPTWRLTAFKTAFALETGQAADLLRVMGYAEVSESPSVWAERTE
ncbi:hypothetical protein [Microbacterium sp. NPDC056234]|uniref:hypothetical protein n=1 Tax=Microbacterium sp. NPDC056234 TaxID=3345757 RepID=UPI0035D6B03A